MGPPHFGSSPQHHSHPPSGSAQGSVQGSARRSSSRRYDEESILSSESNGWRGETDSEIKERVLAYATEQLQARGRLSTATLKIIMANLPSFHPRMTGSQRSTIIGKFTSVSKHIKPTQNDIYISLAEWWRMINGKANELGWTCAMRFRFLVNTGGLPPTGEYEVRAERVKAFMDRHEEWLPRYEDTTSEEKLDYWLFIWVDVGLKFIYEFYTVQPTEMIEEGLVAYMNQPEHLINASCDDVLNSQFHKVHAMWRAMNVHLRLRSAAMVDSPQVTWRLLVEWLEKQKPGGPMMMIHVRKALRKLAINPQEVLPLGHGLSDSEIGMMVANGGVNPSEKTLDLVLQKLKEKALLGDLDMVVTTRAQLSNMIAPEVTSGRVSGNPSRLRGNTRSANSVQTDMSTLTMNTNTGYGQPGGGERPIACETCALFHNGKCRLVTTKGRHHVEGLLAHRSLVQISPDGLKKMSLYWRKKLIQFYFPKLKYSQAETDKALKDVDEAIAKLPKANREEIERYARDMRSYVNAVEVEERSNIKELKKERDLIVNYVAGLRVVQDTPKDSRSKPHRGSESKTKARRNRQRAKKEEESDSSDKSDGSDEDYSGSESDCD
mgnify:CR=1 FL=1